MKKNFWEVFDKDMKLETWSIKGHWVILLLLGHSSSMQLESGAADRIHGDKNWSRLEGGGKEKGKMQQVWIGWALCFYFSILCCFCLLLFLVQNGEELLKTFDKEMKLETWRIQGHRVIFLQLLLWMQFHSFFCKMAESKHVRCKLKQNLVNGSTTIMPTLWWAVWFYNIWFFFSTWNNLQAHIMGMSGAWFVHLLVQSSAVYLGIELFHANRANTGYVVCDILVQ